MRFLNGLKVREKLALLLALAAVALIATTALAASFLYDKMVSDREQQTKHLVEVAVSLVRLWHGRELAGLTEQAAQAGAIAELRALRFGNNDYYFIQRYDGVVVLNPNLPSLEGKERWNARDPDGVARVRIQIDAARRGGDFVYYRMPRAGGKKPLPKLSYIAGFDPWQWAIGSGVYIDDISHEFRALLLKLSVIAGAILLGAAFCAYLIGLNISKPLARLKDKMERLASGDLTVQIAEAERRDEVGDMGRAVSIFKQNAIAKLELEMAMNHADRIDALGRLAGGVAHDLNNALVPVLAMTKSIMGRMPANSRDRTGLELVLTGAGRAKDLVQQILAFCRKQPVEMREMDLAQVVIDAVKMLRASLPTVKLASTVDTVPNIYGDPGQLYQVVVNLATNAAHAIGDGPGTITVTLESADPAHVRLTVADDGCGMDERTVARIFEPFYTTKEAGKGTGLGLSLVHGIVTAHHGTIRVDSKPGVGTRFEIVLPVAAAVPEASSPPPAQPETALIPAVPS